MLSISRRGSKEIPIIIEEDEEDRIQVNNLFDFKYELENSLFS